MSSFKLIDRNGCPLCSSTEASVHHAFSIPVLRCSSCSFLYAGETLAEDALNEYYADFAGDRQKHGQLVNATVNEVAVRKLMKGRPFESMLDVGTGYGFLLERLRNSMNIDVAGVELSQAEASYARENLDIDVRQCLLASAGFEKESFDLVACFETIEHIPDPISFVRELGEYVKPGKFLLINTDNFESWVVRTLGTRFPKWIPHTHISDFSPQSLTQCVKAAGGFEIVDGISYSNWEMVAKALVSKVLKKDVAAEDAFDLESTLKNEMKGGYKLFQLRRLVNRIWFSVAHKNNLDGSLMFLLARKTP